MIEAILFGILLEMVVIAISLHRIATALEWGKK